jgi:putative membrane protein (TIGR04086 family)
MESTASDLRLVRVSLVGLGAYILSLALVFLVVTVYAVMLGFEARGAPDQALIQEFAENVGSWLGPASALLLTFLGGLWVARKVDARGALHGLLVGVVVALISVALALLSSGLSLRQTLLVGAIVATGWIGGTLGARRAVGA